ncbi:hypothetical protein [Kitasatospora purpeofusca]|uniref:hypothetical protein n=1 Tax=Kitasatospora purpeofusca TaxID=67352 RepID=UPI0036D2AA70
MLSAGREIERRFLVADHSIVRGRSGNRIAQAYLFADSRTILRVGRRHGGWRLTVKEADARVARREFHAMLPDPFGHELFDSPYARVSVKCRHPVEHAGRLWLVDVFEGAMKGLVLAEIELSDEAERIDVPPWCGEEVTTVPGYSDHALAVPRRLVVTPRERQEAEPW